MFARAKRIPPIKVMVLGEYDLVQAEAYGAPMVMSDTPKVPIKSICAGVASAKGPSRDS